MRAAQPHLMELRRRGCPAAGARRWAGAEARRAAAARFLAAGVDPAATERAAPAALQTTASHRAHDSVVFGLDKVRVGWQLAALAYTLRCPSCMAAITLTPSQPSQSAHIEQVGGDLCAQWSLRAEWRLTRRCSCGGRGGAGCATLRLGRRRRGAAGGEGLGPLCRRATRTRCALRGACFPGQPGHFLSQRQADR